MSTSTVRRSTRRPTRATPAPERRAEREARERRQSIRVVDPKVESRRTRHRRLMGLAAVVVVAGMFAVSIVHATLVARQRQLDDLRSEIAAAEEDRGRLEREVAIASAPDTVLQRAFRLGMVRAVEPVYLVATEGGE